MPAKANGSKKGRKKAAGKSATLDPEEVAEEAGLRYVSDEQPGYSRKAKGDEFKYFDTQGKPIVDEARLLRIRRIAVPPAYTDVWICPRSNGHIQATGRDARGRKQYRYHERWREVRDENKYGKMLLFGKALPKIRQRVQKDLSLPGLQREKVLATIVELLERTFIRIGNEEYAKENNSFGLTTLRNRHLDVSGTLVRLQFRGKSGVHHKKEIRDRRLSGILRKLQDLPGQDLMQYVDDEGEVRNLTSQDVNDYLNEISGEDFTAKDFRTWAGTVLAAVALDTVGLFENKTHAKANIKEAVRAVSQLLGNTPAICRKCYVHPVIFENYLKGEIIDGLKRQTRDAIIESEGELHAVEAAVLKFLELKLAAAA